MNEPIIINNLVFDNQELLIIIDKYNNAWFYGNQIAKILGYDKGRAVINAYVNEKYTKTYLEIQNMINKKIIIPNNINNITKFINEIGLWQLIIRSKQIKTDRFQEWIYNLLLSIKTRKIDILNKIEYPSEIKNLDNNTEYPSEIQYLDNNTECSSKIKNLDNNTEYPSKVKSLLKSNEDLSLQLKNEIKLNNDLYNLLQKEIELNNDLFHKLVNTI